jgi:hypothetical protein
VWRTPGSPATAARRVRTRRCATAATGRHRRGRRPRCRAPTARVPASRQRGPRAPRSGPWRARGSRSETARPARRPAARRTRSPPPPSSAARFDGRCGSPGRPPHRARSSPAQARPGSRPPAPLPRSDASRAAPIPTARRATTAVLRSTRSGSRGCASTPVLSSSWGASWLAPAATGDGGPITSQQGSTPTEFPALLGLHPRPRRQYCRRKAARHGRLSRERTSPRPGAPTPRIGT